ncbi:MAG: ATPase [Ruminococcus sp.]|nr:ATPase [Ruminococcus sp.]
MSIEKMEYLSIVGLMDDLDETLKKCVESGCFHINEISDEQDSMVRVDGENPYKPLLKRIVSMNMGADFEFKELPAEQITHLTPDDIEQDVSLLESKLRVLSDEIENLSGAISERKRAAIQLSHLKGMKNDLQKLFTCTHIEPRFGRMPVESFQKLSYYEDKPFIFIPYDDDGNYKWGIYFAPLENIREVNNIFKSLYFEKIWLPDFITDTPEEECEKLKNHIDTLEKRLDEKQSEYNILVAENKQVINSSFCRIKYLYDLYELRRYALCYKDKFYLSGYVPKKQYNEFLNLAEAVPSVSIVSKPAENDSQTKVPVKLKTNRFAKPFSMFVEMYGLPSYGGFNPTNLVAWTYTLMFGIMFGDLGQGLLISLIGFIVYKKSGNLLGAILQRVGISSAVFGLVYGSVFGFEHLLDPLYHAIGLKHKPIEIMDSTMTILLGAICIGVAIILISITINIFISFRQRNYTEAIFGNNGISGLVLFGSLLAGVAVMMTGGESLFTMPYVICLIIIPLLLMFFREPLGAVLSGKKYRPEGGIGDFIASNFFEVFEFILGYATNTLSFVRIGGFIFSHAGMMSVVMLLSESVSAGVSPVVIVIGNLFVMGMEGLIVGIQVLRLEFYEVFSRFYDGDGVAFEPVRINYQPDID